MTRAPLDSQTGAEIYGSGEGGGLGGIVPPLLLSSLPMINFGRKVTSADFFVHPSSVQFSIFLSDFIFTNSSIPARRAAFSCGDSVEMSFVAGLVAAVVSSCSINGGVEGDDQTSH